MNEILAGAGRAEAEGGSPAAVPQRRAEGRSPAPLSQRPDLEVPESEPDPVRRATLQQLRAAGVSLAPSQPDDR